MVGNVVDAGAPEGARSSEAERGGAVLGWGLVLGLPLAGAALAAVAAAQGAPFWLPAAFLALGAAAFLSYGAMTYRPGRRAAEAIERAERRARELERELAAAFEHLGAGDLVRSAERGAALPAGLAAGLGAAAESLSGLAERIQAGSTQIAAAAEDVHRIAADLASGSSQQAASVVEITAAMEELARTAAHIAGSAERQAELAERAEASGEAGAVAVEEAVGGVEEVRRRISGIAARADDLGTRSKEIYRVLDLITEIADETHILSLNAAIEGAAAGAEGRRFAVVAEEVRRLAHRSRESVDSVRGLLDEFSGSIRATIVATEEGGKEASRVLDGARAASGAIVALREVAGDTARVAREISLATRQQNAASDEVVTTLREVSLVVQRMSGGLRQLTETADRLNRLGMQIQMLAQVFHLDSPRSLKHLVEQWCAELDGTADHAEILRAVDERVQGIPFLELGFYVDVAGYTVALQYNRAIATAAAAQAQRGAEWAREIDMRRRPWFQAVSRHGRTSLTPLYLSLHSGEPCFTVAGPVRDTSGSLLGVLGFDINLATWARI